MGQRERHIDSEELRRETVEQLRDLADRLESGDAALTNVSVKHVPPNEAQVGGDVRAKFADAGGESFLLGVDER